MYVHGIMMITFLSLLHVLYVGSNKANKGLELANAMLQLGTGLMDAVKNALNGGTNKESKRECLQCVDAKVDDDHLRKDENYYRTPGCAKAQRADESGKITLKSCSSCGRLAANIKLFVTEISTKKKEETTLYLHVRGCFNLNQDKADGCSADEEVIKEQIETLGVNKQISDFQHNVLQGNYKLETGKVNGLICNNAVVASRIWWILWSVMMANFTLV